MAVEVLSRAELLQRLGTRDRLERALERQLYRRVLRGFFVDGELADSPDVRCAALRRALPDDVALAGRTALWAMTVDVLPRNGRLDLTVPRGRHLVQRPGMRALAALLPDDELVDLPGGLVAVSAPRAFVDVARREPLVEAVALGDAVLRSGAATEEQLVAAVERARRAKGVVAARQVLPHLEPRSESQGESRLRMRLVQGGLPRPEAQVDLYDERGVHIGRVDLKLGGLLLEYDGRTGRNFGRDRRRQNRLVDLDGELRRYTSEEVTWFAAPLLCADVARAYREHPDLSPRLFRGPDTLRPPRLTPLPTRADLRCLAA